MQVNLSHRSRVKSVALLSLGALVAWVAGPVLASAQVVVPDREAAEVFRQRNALIQDRVQELERAFRGQIEEFDEIAMPRMIMRGGPLATSISVSEVDGVRTTKVNENGRQFVIQQSADSIEVTYAKVYGPDDLEALQQDHPDLYMHVTSFPKQSQGADVELSISLKTTRQAANAEELKEKFPEAFAIYEKYGQQRGLGIRIDAGAMELAPRLRDRMKMLEIKPAPDFFERFNRQGAEGEEPPAEEVPKPRRTIKT